MEHIWETGNIQEPKGNIRLTKDTRLAMVAMEAMVLAHVTTMFHFVKQRDATINRNNV